MSDNNMVTGLISRHHRPVYWSPSSRTALAEAELEYDDNHQCTAAFVKMPFVRLPEILERAISNSLQSEPRIVSALIWTTTPWTLPANKAIAVNSNMEYTLVMISRPDADEDVLLLAKNRLAHVLFYLPEGTTATVIVDNILGRELADGESACLNLFTGEPSPILEAGFVTDTSGTGVVHMAPGHGMEDYQVCQVNKIGSAFAPVDDEGRFTDDVFQAGDSGLLKGLDAQTDGVDAVLKILAQPGPYLPTELHEDNGSLVLATHSFTHKNPIDWRTKQPVIVRATAQWFADVSAIKDRALNAIERVNFIPEGGKTRLKSFVEGRNQWCISRQRAWGVPIPALYHEETGEVCISQVSIDHIIATIKERGTDAWFSDPPDERAWIHPSLELEPWTRGRDTMDVWFDSGTTWTTLDGKHSDVYVEGTDQHRGWFQSSLLTYVAALDDNKKPRAPYDTLITHGFTLDANFMKMSKSIGNVISPDQIMDGSLLPPIKARNVKMKDSAAQPGKLGLKHDAMGPDVLRLWVASSEYTRDVSISVPVLRSVQQALQKYRVTFKFLLGNLNGYTRPRSNDLDANALTFADAVVLRQLSKTSQIVYQAYGEYKFYKAVNEINTFINSDLSAFYFEVIKDRMYAGSRDVRSRTQQVLFAILHEMMTMLGPVTPHLVEEVWEFLPGTVKEQCGEHPLRRVWDGPFTPPFDSDTQKLEELESGTKVFNDLSTAVKLAQEAARMDGKVGSGLACKVEVQLPKEAATYLRKHLDQWRSDEELADLLVVSQAVVKVSEDLVAASAEWRYEQSFEAGTVERPAEGKVIVLPPDQLKCVRCWKYTADEEGTPCKRCQDVLHEMECSKHSD